MDSGSAKTTTTMPAKFLTSLHQTHRSRSSALARIYGTFPRRIHPLSEPSIDILRYSPGRFFAATFLKIVLVHFMLNYDVKLDPTQLPRDYYFGPDILPGSTAKFLVRERKRE